jgi:hypothetical protein
VPLTCGTVGLASMMISSPGRKLAKSRDEIAREEDAETEEELDPDPDEEGGDLFAAALATANSFLYVC